MKALITNRHLISRIVNLAFGKSLSSNGAEFKDVPIPTISDDEILVKVKAVALNPTDFKHIDAISPPSSIVGCDYAGEVTKVGKNAASVWKVGDRVAGAVHGGLYPDRGAFAEYLKTDSDLCWRIPAEIEDTAAATYGVSAVTAMHALNARLGLPWADDDQQNTPRTDPKDRPTILVYAGSTSAGLFTIQLAKAAGYTVVTTASPHSFDLVDKYGADAAFDYRDPSVVDKILANHPNISSAVDCISEGVSTDICGRVLRPNGGKIITLLPGAKSKYPGVESELVMSYTLFGRAFQWLPPVGPKFPALPEDRKALVRFYSSLPRLTATVKPPPVKLEGVGFDAILTGLDKLRAGKVSGAKLVVKMV
ncbi:GroES-like protein [Melanomma pulvis-pyrius CBS 109.77]|uniref:GroES-like protein n=1 Tax=Melanomma pulvis-pyrius CBS 109.77 TaxID=1314802 RepID=A0A6A6XBI8_9PLEO|nr:GroES-like protein [Melanomma pulvis-pyrius CBS 109.77]